MTLSNGARILRRLKPYTAPTPPPAGVIEWLYPIGDRAGGVYNQLTVHGAATAWQALADTSTANYVQSVDGTTYSGTPQEQLSINELVHAAVVATFASNVYFGIKCIATVPGTTIHCGTGASSGLIIPAGVSTSEVPTMEVREVFAGPLFLGVTPASELTGGDPNVFGYMVWGLNWQQPEGQLQVMSWRLGLA